MSKKRLSDVDTERLGLLKRVERDGETYWDYAALTPSWVYKYLLQRCMDRMESMAWNPLTSLDFAEWIRGNYPDDAVMFGLADFVNFSRADGVVQTYYDVGRTGVQYRDTRCNSWVRITDSDCPAAMAEYAVTRHPECIDRVGGRVRSEVFMDEEFAEWVCRRDQNLASLLGLGVRQAVRLADEAEA